MMTSTRLPPLTTWPRKIPSCRKPNAAAKAIAEEFWNTAIMRIFSAPASNILRQASSADSAGSSIRGLKSACMVVTHDSVGGSNTISPEILPMSPHTPKVRPARWWHLSRYSTN